LTETKPVRRKQEDRSAETQARLLEATIDVLNRAGYAAATTTVVIETSGVTRGGMLHHYPSKVDLMIATAEHCLVKMREARRGRPAGAAGQAALLEIERSRYGVALTELMMGSRSDPELATRFRPVARAILASQSRAAGYIAEQAGIDDVREVEVMVWMNMAAIRGMTLMQLAGVDDGFAERATEIMVENRAAFLARLRKAPRET